MDRPNLTTETTLNRKDIDFDVLVEANVSGSYRPATFDDPEEGPEIDYLCVRAINIKTGKPLKGSLTLSEREQSEIDRVLDCAMRSCGRDPYY